MNSNETVNYLGLQIYLSSKMDRELTRKDMCSILSFDRMPKEVCEEAKGLARISSSYAIAYMRFKLAPELAKHAASFVENVLLGDKKIDDWIRENLSFPPS